MSELLPFALPRLIAPGDNDPGIRSVGSVFHVAVSEGSSLEDYFAHRSGGIESHGYIRRDGTVEQYRTLDREADAQSQGNSWVRDGVRYGFWSWETQGMGEGTWTNAQLVTIQRIMLYGHRHFGHPLRLCPGPFAAGMGYHSLFREWNPNAHTCPGPDRIRQFHNVLVPWMRDQRHPQTKDWLDMATKDELAALIDAALEDKGRQVVREEIDRTLGTGLVKAPPGAHKPSGDGRWTIGRALSYLCGRADGQEPAADPSPAAGQ